MRAERGDDVVDEQIVERRIKAREGGAFAGVQFVFTEHDPYTGIDLDDCLDADGVVAPGARAILDMLNSYREISPNGSGIWCGGGVTPNIRNNLAWQNLPSEGVGTCSDWWNSDGNVLTDPFFCDPASLDFSVSQNSPALTHPAGPLGALYLPGCGPVSVEPTTWGQIKAKYRSGP